MGELAKQLRAERGDNRVHREPALTVILREMSDEDRADLLDALADLSLGAPAIHRVLTARGYKIGVSAIKAYRRGEIVNVYEG